MLKLITQPNLTAPRPAPMNLRPGQSAPNFALAQNVVSEGFLANLKYLLTEREVAIPADAEGSAFLAQHFRASFVDNLKECFQPTPKFTGNAVPSLRGMASPEIRIESQPLYMSLLSNIREFMIPSKLPPLELTSKPIEVPEIWSKQRRLSGANLTSTALHVGLTVLVVAITVRQAPKLDPVKPVAVLIAAPAPTAHVPLAPVAAPTVTHRTVYAKRKSFFVQGKLVAPTARLNPTNAERKRADVTAPYLSAGGTSEADPGGVLGGVLGGQSGGLADGLLGGTSVPPPPAGVTTPEPTTTKPKVIRVGGDVKRPRAIYAPEPELPFLALQGHITGTVILEAVIDEHGNVVELRGVSGEGLLIRAALKAVARWKFEPTYLNGAPIAVEMEFQVRFH